MSWRPIFALAIRRGELELRFQPIVDLETQTIVNCEALARWRHPRRGFMSPASFIPVAEETGLIAEIGEWVIGQACAAARTWPDSVRISINLSPYQFDRTDLVDTVRKGLSASGLQADRVELEITESVLLRDNEQVLRTLAGLKALGTRIALDDFGTGYSSLGYLQRFPIDKIKIDQSFVRQMTLKPECVLIVELIGALAKKLGLTTTAEGIETEGSCRSHPRHGLCRRPGLLLPQAAHGRGMPRARVGPGGGRSACREAGVLSASGPGQGASAIGRCGAASAKRRISQDRNTAATSSRSSGAVAR